MADNINVTPGTGSIIAADDVGGVLHQRVKVVIGADGVTNGDVSSSNPMPVQLDAVSLAALENINVTVTTSSEVEVKNDSGNPIPVNGTVTANAGTNLNTSLLALDSTVAKDSSLTTINNSVNTLLKPASTLSAVTTVGGITNTVTVKADTLVNQTNAFKVDGSSVTQPVSAASLPLPSGASTSANQATAIASLSSIDSKLTAPMVVAGSSAIGVAPANNPVSVSGTDVGGLKRHIRLDSSGRLEINTAQSLPLPSGAASSSNQTNGGQKTQIVDGAGLVLGPSIVSGGNNFPIAIGATNYIVSTVNSTAAQLASGATFNGVVETTFNQQSYSILIVTDQPGILTIKNYIDAAGAQLAQSTVFNVPISGFARSGVVNGNYFSISFQNTGPSSTVTLRIDTAYGTIPSATQLNNGPVGLMEINGNSVSTGYGVSNSGVLRTVDAKELSYSASISSLVMPLLPTDIFTITGSATKTVKIHRLIISGSQSSAANRDLIVLKRSTANSGGVSTTLTAVASDSTSAAATAVVRAYTTNPIVGTLVGAIRSKLWPLLGSASANNGQFGPDNQAVFKFGELGSQPIVLRGTSEVLSINFNGITSAGSLMYFSIEWSEE